MIVKTRFYNGLTIENLTDRSKTMDLSVSNSATASTKTILQSLQSANRTIILPDASTTLVGTDATQTLTNKTLTGNTAVNLISGSGTLVLNTTGTITVPNATDTLVGRTTTDTLTNKTLTAPIIATITNTGTLTLPTSTDTLVGRATTDTLTNKNIHLTTAAKTANYTVLSTDDFVSGSASGGAFTFTLPAASSNAGKVYRLKKTDSSTNAITIARAGSDTIDGATSTKLSTQYEILTIISDGSATWNILSRDYPRTDVAFSPSITGISTGTINGFWWRDGNKMNVNITVSYTSGSAALAIAMPTGYTIDTTNLTTGATVVGQGIFQKASTLTGYTGAITLIGSTSLRIDGSFGTGGAVGRWSSSGNVPAVWNTNDGFTAFFTVPIVGWS